MDNKSFLTLKWYELFANYLRNGYLFFLEGRRRSVLFAMCLFDLFLTIFVSLLITYTVGSEVSEIDFLEGESLADIFVTSVFFAPLIETLLFQFMIIELTLLLFRKFQLKNGFYIPILLSSILFGLSHSYNIYYIGYAVLAGAVFAFFYLIARNRRDMNGYLVVFVVHAFSNFFAFLLNEMFNM